MSNIPAEDRIKKSEILAGYTSISLGGPADYFLECLSVDDIRFGIEFAKTNSIPFFILGGGSNTVFSDDGLRGIVLKISLKKRDFEKTDEGTLLAIGAGEIFDEIVSASVERELCGIECLSGIPGSAGATAVQNVGAYGQEVAESIQWVDCLDIETSSIVRLNNQACRFGYRNSFFKTDQKNRYIIIEVSFLLHECRNADIKYKELELLLDEKYESKRDVHSVRKAVIELRKKKSMVLDPKDPNSVSCGSFFTNPVIDEEGFRVLKKRMADRGESVDILPVYPVTGGYKVSAAFLVEHSGYTKGYRKNHVGVSSVHALALVNYGGTSKDLIELSEEIQNKVRELYGIVLCREPIYIAGSENIKRGIH